MNSKSMREISERVAVLRFKVPEENMAFIARSKALDGATDYEFSVAPLVALGWTVKVERDNDEALRGWTVFRPNASSEGIASGSPELINKPATTKTLFAKECN